MLYHRHQQATLDELGRLIGNNLSVHEVLQASFPVDYWNRGEKTPSDDTPRLVFMLEGMLNYHVGESVFPLTTGFAIFMSCSMARSWITSHGPVRMAWCRFGERATLNPLWFPCEVDLTTEANAFSRLQRSAAQQGIWNDIAAESEIKAILARFAVQVASSTASEEGSRRRVDTAVRRGIDFLNKNYARPDAVSTLAEQFDVSPAYFRRRFRRLTGVSPQAFVINLRMAKARYHLTQSDLLVKQVAQMVGYQDPYLFSRLFRRHFGHPPARVVRQDGDASEPIDRSVHQLSHKAMAC